METQISQLPKTEERRPHHIGVRIIIFLIPVAVAVCYLALKQQQVFVDRRPMLTDQNSSDKSQTSPFKVTSPKGGEQWAIGSTHTVAWTVNPSASGDGVEISIEGENPNKCHKTSGTNLGAAGIICDSPEVYTIARNTGNNGEFDWKISNDIKPGKYKLSVILYKNPAGGSPYVTLVESDASDDFFEILPVTEYKQAN